MKQASLTILIFANVMLFCVEIAVSRPPAEVNNAVTIDAADPRIPLATCSLLCKHVYGVRREYAEDSRGIFHPVYECVDQQIIQFQARSDNCRSCLKGCSKFKHFVEAEQKLEESVLATKPSLHCYTWTMPEQVTIGDSVDKDGGLVPAMYIKWDVILKNLSGVLGGGKISNRMPAVAFLVDGRMVPSPFDKDSGEPREWMPLYETINSYTEALRLIAHVRKDSWYQWRITGITEKGAIIPTVVSEPIPAVTIGTSPFDKPSKVPSSKILRWVRTNERSKKMSAVLVWEPNAEKSCTYEVHYNSETSGQMIWRDIQVFSAFMATLENMAFSDMYTFRIFAKNFITNQESEPYMFNAVSPSCLELYNNSFQFCPPPPPDNVDIFWDGDVIRVRWSRPQYASEDNTIQSIFVTLEKFKPFSEFTIPSIPEQKHERSFKINVPGDATEANFTGQSQESYYVAWLHLDTPGGFVKSKEVLLKTVNQSYETNNHVHSSTFNSRAKLSRDSTKRAIIVIIVEGVVFLVFVVLVIAYCFTHYKIPLKKWFTSFRKQTFEMSSSEQNTIDASPLSSPVISNSVDCDSTAYVCMQPISGTGGPCRAVSLSPVADPFELTWEQIAMQEVIGQGTFGVVRKAKLKLSTDMLHAGISSARESCTKQAELYETVAIKMLKEGSGMEEFDQLKNEVEVLKTMRPHLNIVTILGAITQSRPMALVVQYCPYGDLLTKLRKLKEKQEAGVKSICSVHNAFYSSGEESITEVQQKNTEEVCTSADLMSFAHQIASGMEFLSLNKVVHRDLAARNILFCGPKHVKISDFGLSRDIYARNMYEKTSNGKVPIRWMAPESISHQLYTAKSDVWSFGILLWEIATLGGVPYPGIEPQNLLPFLQQGCRMSKPRKCSEEVYKIMLMCWQTASSDRPKFSDLKLLLENMLEDSTSDQYLTLL